MTTEYFGGITQAELDEMWDYVGHEYFDTYEAFKKDYIQKRKDEHQVRQDNIERHNWLYSVNG